MTEKKAISVKDIALIGMMIATIEIAKITMAALPNIELTSFLIIVYTLYFGKRILFVIPAFILLEGTMCRFWHSLCTYSAGRNPYGFSAPSRVCSDCPSGRSAAFPIFFWPVQAALSAGGSQASPSMSSTASPTSCSVSFSSCRCAQRLTGFPSCFTFPEIRHGRTHYSFRM